MYRRGVRRISGSGRISAINVRQEVNTLMEQTNSAERSSKKTRDRLSGFFKAFLVLFALFFAAGFFTLGSFKSTGKTFSYTSGSGNVAVFDLKMSEKQSKLTEVWINVGNVYVAPGSDVTVTVKRSASSAAKPTSTFGSVSIGNFYSTKKDGKNGANFNWIPVAVDKSVTAASVSVSATSNFDLNEIVCIADDGKPVEMSVNTEYTQGFSGRLNRLSHAVDARNSFTRSNAAYHNFTAEEGYYMTSIHTVLGGSSVQKGSVYTVDGDFNSLATVLLLPSVAIFGDSTFALRLVPFLATCATLFFVYLLGGLLFKEEKYGFVFALIFALGGLATTVGRLGAPYALVTCFLVGSLYFMYRFFAKGISSDRVVKDGLNVLFSGLFAAFALAMNALTVFAVLGILVLFAFGMRRQKKAYENELNKAAASVAAEVGAETSDLEIVSETSEASESDIVISSPDGPTAVYVGKESEIGKENKKIKARYGYKNRICWGFASISFIAVTFLLILFSSIATYSAYVKAYDPNPSSPSLSYAALLWKGISAPFRISNVTEYTNANAVNVLAWLLPLKAATVYDGILEIGSYRYLAWNVSMNAAVSAVALLAFAFTTVSVLFELFSKNRSTRNNKRNRRIWLVLFGGIVCSMLSAAFVKNISAVHSSLFGVFYIGFIPLAVRMAQPEKASPSGDGKAKTSFAEIVLIVCLAVFFVFFVLSVPGLYGFAIPAKAAKYMFWWSSVVTNGYFRP